MQSRRIFLFALVLSVFASSPRSSAYEVDNFTRRRESLPDSRGPLNAETQRQIDLALAEENASGPCAVPTTMGTTPIPRILQRISNRLDTNPVAMIENWAIEDLPSGYRHEVASNRTIYSEVSAWDAPVLSAAGVEPSLRVAGRYIGADKLGHFMAQGYEYFQLLWQTGSVQKALEYGRRLEDGVYGIKTTGVRSFGDLSANFGGMTFYRDLLYGPDPLLRCEGGRWTRVRNFDWASYVNDAWDEGTNCSEFYPGVATSVQKALQNRGMSCPVEASRCAALANLPCSAAYVSAACRASWPSGSAGGSCPARLEGLPTPLAALAPTPHCGESASAVAAFLGTDHRLSDSPVLNPEASSLYQDWERARESLEDPAPSNLSEERTT